jgi:predicted transcriptional regulator YdeE
MKLNFEERSTFYISGFFIETCLDTCENDVSKLWDEFQTKKEILYETLGRQSGFYGLMWYVENHRYCYLLGIETDNPTIDIEGGCCKCVPKTQYAVTEVPSNKTIVEVWTEFFEKVLPNAGYLPNAEHGMYFEYYPNNNIASCQLWTPITKVE